MLKTLPDEKFVAFLRRNAARADPAMRGSPWAILEISREPSALIGHVGIQ
jgi:hypothetical protein